MTCHGLGSLLSTYHHHHPTRASLVEGTEKIGLVAVPMTPGFLNGWARTVLQKLPSMSARESAMSVNGLAMMGHR